MIEIKLHSEFIILVLGVRFPPPFAFDLELKPMLVVSILL
jgi:hypothetical protein